MEMAHFKKYSSFSEKRYAFARVKWQSRVQPCIIIYDLAKPKSGIHVQYTQTESNRLKAKTIRVSSGIKGLKEKKTCSH